MPDLAPTLQVSSTATTDVEKQLLEEAVSLNAKVFARSKVINEMKAKADASAIENKIEAVKREIAEKDSLIDKTKRSIEAKTKELEEIKSKSKTQTEDEAIERLERELAKLSNKCLKSENDCKKREDQYQKNQTEIKTLQAKYPNKKVTPSTAALPTASALLSQPSVSTVASVGLSLDPVGPGQLLAGHYCVSSIDGNGPSNNGVIQVDDILLKIDGLEVSGKSQSKIESMLQGPDRSTVYLEFLRPCGYGQFLNVATHVTRRI